MTKKNIKNLLILTVILVAIWVVYCILDPYNIFFDTIYYEYNLHKINSIIMK